NGSSSHPTPYGTYYENFKQQYLILASELTEKGLSLGNITAIAFNVADKNDCSEMPNYRIYIKTTELTELTENFEEGTYHQVWFQENYLPTDGWNTHTFNDPYYWDGVSNLIVQICTDMITGSWTDNASVYYTTTTAYTCLRYQSDNYVACDAVTGSPSKDRANMQISWDPTTDPFLLFTPSYLSFGYVPNGSSSVLSYNLSGMNLTDGPILSITAPANFTVSLNGEGPFSESVQVTYTPPTLNSTPIYVKFTPSETGIEYNGEITNVGGGTSKNLPVTGRSKIQYCEAKTNNCDEYIINVTVGTINNSSGYSVGGYADYSDISTDMRIGQFYPISVTNEKNYNMDYCGIWVDWNNNGSFYDENETIMISNTMTNQTYHSTITPPLGTPEGSVRMRIRINFGSNVDPCGITTWGEVEDYTINVLPPQYGSLSGYVTDPIAGPIEGARVFSGSYEAFTDAEGYYEIESLFVGVYDVSCEADTYHTQVKTNIEITENNATSLDFELTFAEILVAPSSIEATLEPGEIDAFSLTISNPGGTAPLTWRAKITSMTDRQSSLPILTQQQPKVVGADDVNPNPSGVKPDHTDAMLDLLGSFPVNDAGGTFGIVCGEDFLYTGRWNANGYDRYSLEGVFLNHFEIPGAGFTRDLTFDGEYFYGSPRNNTIYQMDFLGQTLVSTITTTGNTIRGISYDPDNDAFWITSNDWAGPLKLISRTGETLKTLNTYIGSIGGIAYDNVSEGGPFLWAYTGGQEDIHTLIKVDLTTGEALQTFDLLPYGIFGDETVSGGLEITNAVVPGKYTLIGCSQNDIIFVLELADEPLKWINIDHKSGTVLAGETMNLGVTLNSTGLDDGIYLASIDITHDGREITEGVVSVPVTMTVTSTKGNLSGLVFNENNQRLEGVKVTTENASLITYTNALGRYKFEDLEIGLYDVSFEKENYLPQTFTNIEIKKLTTTELNVYMEPMPPPTCPELVYPGIDETVMPDITLQWEASAPYTATGYKLYLYNTSSDIWVEENTDIGNVTSYTPAEPFEIGSYYAWLLVPYNNAGETEGCEAWYFWVTPTGKLTGVVTDEVTGLPIENVEIFIEQLSGDFNTTIFTDADGAYEFEWKSGNYKVTFSKYAYTAKINSPVAVNPFTITVLDVALDPLPAYSIPFFEDWTAGTFTDKQWTIVPPTANWNIHEGEFGNTAIFYWAPVLENYSHRLQSSLINGVGKDKVYAQFDFCLENYVLSTVEKLIFEVFDGNAWHTVHTFTNQGGSIPCSAFNFDISQYVAGKVFQIGFTAEGEDTNSIYYFIIDNISLTSELMAVEPSAISDQLVVPATSQHPITITNLGPKALVWNAAGLPPWASLSASNGTIAGYGNEVIQLNLNSEAASPGVYQVQLTITGAGELASEIIDIQLDILDLVINPTSVNDKLQVGETAVWDIEISNPGPYILDWEVNLATKADWAAFDIESGTLQIDEAKVLKLTLDATQLAQGQYTADFLFTTADGLIEKTFTVSLTVYDIAFSPEALYDVLHVGETSTYPLTITNTGLEAINWNAVITDNWANLSALNGTIEAGESVTLDFTFNATGMLPGDYSSSMSFTAFDDKLIKEIIIGLKVLDEDTDFQKIPLPLPNSWGYISTYIDLDKNGKMTLEVALNSILDKMVIMIGHEGFFWPSQNTNTIGNWNLETAYKLKMQKEGLLVFYGSEIEDKNITFPAGTHLVPVINSNPLSAADIFEGRDIEFAFSLDGLIYWPLGNIFTLETLVPGLGYLVKFNSETTLNFQNAKSSVNQNVVSIFENTTPWNDAYNTANVHLVGVSENAASALQIGDFIGVFNSEGLCTGLTKYVNKDKAFLIPVYGDDFSSEYIDGMKEGEYMTVKVFSNGKVIEVDPVYNTKLSNWEGLYVTNGLSQIADLKMSATGINADEDVAIRIYPNPSNGIFNISGADASYQVIVTNAQGQIVYNQKLSSDRLDLTNQPTGVYFIKLIGNNQTVTQKIVIR
ncbi:MAG: carboxypeptidase regulatory-like domain-containing protein, partial [Bacteroidales bacterium]